MKNLSPRNPDLLIRTSRRPPSPGANGCFRRSMAVRVFAIVTIAAFGGCKRPADVRWQGYLDAEFIHVGAPLAGRLDGLLVRKGERVAAQTRLFALERRAEIAAQQQAEAQLVAAQARLEDLRKGSRPSELAGLEAQSEQARAAAELARIDFQRMEALRRTDVVAESDYDRTRLNYERANRALDQLTAQMDTARLGGRADAIRAAEAEVRAAQANKDKADWSVAQKDQVAPRDALVFDTLYRPGEFVQAGNPVVSLLAPELLKVRFFVPESEFATLQAGNPVKVMIAGRALTATVSYLSPQPEYTPPVLYNRENRSKLVFMVEAVFEAKDAEALHPGQPVDVTR